MCRLFRRIQHVLFCSCFFPLNFGCIVYIINVHLKNKQKIPLQIANPLLDDAYKQTEEKVQEKVTGSNKVVLISDGWSNLRNESIINIILATPEPVFYKYIDASQNSHTAVYISSIFNDVIKELGKIVCFLVFFPPVPNTGK